MAVTQRTIDIRPTTDIYATYRRLSYKPWYAIAEFVDNSVQNFRDHRDSLTKAAEDQERPLEIRVWHDPGERTLTVADNANGMELEEVERAVQLNKPPPDPHGLSEFGMGLKTAACWLGSKWTIRSKQLGSENEYIVEVDTDELISQKPESVALQVSAGNPLEDHYTIIEIERMHRVFRGRTLGKIKEHLASMYRQEIREGDIGLYYQDDFLDWEDDPVFEERLPDGTRLTWRKTLDFTVEDEQTGLLPVKGWVGIRFPGNARRAGFHLLRYERLIVGGPGEGWKPWEIFGAPNSFESQRLVGELQLDGWPVNQAKDGFDWDGGLEQQLISRLQADTKDYAEKTRAIRRERDGEGPTASDASLAVDTINSEVASEEVQTIVTLIEEEPPPEPATEAEERQLIEIAQATGQQPTLVRIGENGQPTAKFWLLDQAHEREPFMEIAAAQEHELHIFVNLRHPFVTEHVGGEIERLHLYLQFLLAEALVERAALRREEILPPRALRHFKDAFLRSLRRMIE